MKYLVLVCMLGCSESLTLKGAEIQRLRIPEELTGCENMGQISVTMKPFYSDEARVVMLRNLAVSRGGNAIWVDMSPMAAGSRATMYKCPGHE